MAASEGANSSPSFSKLLQKGRIYAIIFVPWIRRSEIRTSDQGRRIHRDCPVMSVLSSDVPPKGRNILSSMPVMSSIRL